MTDERLLVKHDLVVNEVQLEEYSSFLYNERFFLNYNFTISLNIKRYVVYREIRFRIFEAKIYRINVQLVRFFPQTSCP